MVDIGNNEKIVIIFTARTRCIVKPITKQRELCFPVCKMNSTDSFSSNEYIFKTPISKQDKLSSITSTISVSCYRNYRLCAYEILWTSIIHLMNDVMKLSGVLFCYINCSKKRKMQLINYNCHPKIWTHMHWTNSPSIKRMTA